MKEKLYKIFDLLTSESLGTFCYFTFFVSLILVGISGNNSIILIFGLLLFTPTLFFISWFILALIVLGIEVLIIAPIEFVVYKLGIPKIKINVDVIWKYQQRNADEKQS